jgi:hypothetical protein
MKVASMSTQTISTKVGQLSEELQREVLDYIEFLLYKYNHQDENSRQDKNLSRRQEVVQRVDALRERLFTKYGEMSDSVELIRKDRAR